METQRWQQVRAIFDQAVTLPGAARDAFLNSACANDAELRSELDSLLRAHDAAGDFLETPAIELQPTLTDPDTNSARIGSRVGPYQIVEVIGQGGMGEVYRAIRVDGQFDKEVAIKLVRAGWNTTSILERFRRERQILAALENPNIARLYDGGTTADGLPYFAMELIKGERIDAYCDRLQLSITGRLELFRQVCAAVQYAHQRLVIHRDIKPSNILVTHEGIPKLLDFGVATILDVGQPAAETTLFRPITLAYASPEQIRGVPITTASDVYSLGIVLFELLTGHSPYRLRADTPIEVSRAITQAEPMRPSATVSRRDVARSNDRAPEAPADATANAVSRARSTTPAKLRRQLAGDLDNILLLALRKEPERRYGSVQQFDDDIARHLGGVPILASRGSWRYRCAKFVVRNKAAVGATAAVLLALVGGIVTTANQARIAESERARADARFSDVRRLANSLIFDVNDAMASAPGNTPARKLLLDRAVEYLDKLAQDANGNADLQRELAWGYQKLAVVQGNSTESNLGQVQAAESSLQKAIGLFEAVVKAKPSSTPDLLALAMIHRSMGLSDIYYPGGRRQIDAAMAITDRLVETDGRNPKVQWERSLDFQALGLSQDLAGDRVQAVESLRRALTLAEEVLASDPAFPQVREGRASAAVHLGDQLGRAGRLDAARQQLEAGLRAYRDILNEGTHPGLIRHAAHSQRLLGEVELMRGDWNAAERNFAEASEAVARLARLDPDNTVLQWDAVNLAFDQGRLLVLTGRLALAPARFQPALAKYASHPEDDSGPGLGLVFAWLAKVQFGMHQYSEALASLRKSVELLEGDANYDDARCGVAADYALIGDTLLQQHLLKDAAAAYDMALTKADPAFALAHSDTPALYPIADSQAGLGAVTGALARESRSPEQRAQFRSKACAYSRASLETWNRLAPAALFSPSQFPTGGVRAARALSADCDSENPGGAD